MTTARQIVYVGTYTEGWGNPVPRDEGIFVYAFDPSNGSLKFLRTINGVRNPSFLTVTQDYIFSVNELSEFKGVFGSGATAINRATGQIINQQPTHGADSCNIILDPSGRWLFTANYTSGSITVFPVQTNGQLGEAVQVVQDHGHGANPERQEGPHVHCVAFAPDGRYVFASDLGLDQIKIFTLDPSSGQLTPNDPPFAPTKPGAGPRHFLFHPNGRYFYATTELSATVAVFAYDAARGALTPLQTIPTLPADYTGKNLTADIHIASSGRFLYVSNRGHDSIVVYAIDAETGQLTLVEFISADGKTPRNFAFDLTERYLLVAHQDSASLATFHVDQASGKLAPTGERVSLPYPVCVKVVPDV
ncbi:MAG TPA: lactonase family protein [Phototrophicaceae bacterium]|nr:lactonase family protein [Phototrophicaceae bacterium]